MLTCLSFLWLAAAADVAPEAAVPLQVGARGGRVVVTARLEAAAAAELPEGKVSFAHGRKYLTLALVPAARPPAASQPRPSQPRPSQPRPSQPRPTAAAAAAPPIYGDYRRQGRTLTFTPRFKLVPGNTYRAELRGDPAATVIYRPQQTLSAPPKVVAIFPSADALPANHLKFYISFSRPMREGKQVFAAFRLRDSEGREVSDPWRHTELWSDDYRRLTLWIHPGRVKQGLNLREELGPVLEVGRQYELTVERALRDIDNRQLAVAVTKRFRVLAPDRQRPDPARWKLAVPAPGTREPLQVSFGEPLDHPLLFRFLKVRDAEGVAISGDIQVDRRETRWQFTPREAWRPGSYRLHVSELLEDLAGNTPERLFDRDLEGPEEPPPTLVIPFALRAE